MTTLIEKIKESQVTARKARDTLMTNLLTTLIGEAEMVGKNDGNRTPTDAEVVATIKKFMKNLDETLKVVTHSPAVSDLQCERRILELFLPTQITGDALKSIIEAIAVEVGAQPKDMGKVMGLLKARHDGQYDGKEASTLTKLVLTS